MEKKSVPNELLIRMTDDGSKIQGAHVRQLDIVLDDDGSVLAASQGGVFAISDPEHGFPIDKFFPNFAAQAQKALDDAMAENLALTTMVHELQSKISQLESKLNT